MAHHSAPAAGAAQAAVVGTPDEALSTLERTRLVVGFHPDQATEAAVDLALALRVPFAVVPCCVFPSLFPHRRTREGKPVASYDEFVEYLRAKVAGVRTAELPFGGHGLRAGEEPPRSIVLYTLPEDIAPGVSSLDVARKQSAGH
eukprot:PRCOL_00002346-RA